MENVGVYKRFNSNAKFRIDAGVNGNIPLCTILASTIVLSKNSIIFSDKDGDLVAIYPNSVTVTKL